ncbi:hypothetical protein K1719_044302 [Acacia pycnantha]|nr:hypothetical protein K1719_044302 [Acacia pycnantha]
MMVERCLGSGGSGVLSAGHHFRSVGEVGVQLYKGYKLENVDVVVGEKRNSILEILLLLVPSSPSSSLSPSLVILTQDDLKKIVAYKVAEYVEFGMVLGLETRNTHKQAVSLGIPLLDLDSHPTLDLAIDGADEVDPFLNRNRCSEKCSGGNSEVMIALLVEHNGNGGDMCVHVLIIYRAKMRQSQQGSSIAAVSPELFARSTVSTGGNRSGACGRRL